MDSQETQNVPTLAQVANETVTAVRDPVQFSLAEVRLISVPAKGPNACMTLNAAPTTARLRIVNEILKKIGQRHELQLETQNGKFL
jgi:hypothetical protein